MDDSEISHQPERPHSDRKQKHMMKFKTLNTDLIRFVFSFEFANPLLIKMLFVCVRRWNIDRAWLLRSASRLLHDPQIKRHWDFLEIEMVFQWLPQGKIETLLHCRYITVLNSLKKKKKLCNVKLRWFGGDDNQSWSATRAT